LIDFAGIFVGGAASRMGGRPKGLLPSPEGAPIVDRLAAILASLGLGVVLVGDAGPYERLGLERIADEPVGIGPLGGLVALLRRAGSSRALALACDMPFVSREIVERLCVTPAAAPILAPVRRGRWEPLCARYDAARVLPLAISQADAGVHSLQRLLVRAGAAPMPLSEREESELDDWDSPEDLGARRSASITE
jgi:molybdopterin-guanine dinucleotide biosynthesis protein A